MGKGPNEVMRGLARSRAFWVDALRQEQSGVFEKKHKADGTRAEAQGGGQGQMAFVEVVLSSPVICCPPVRGLYTAIRHPATDCAFRWGNWIASGYLTCLGQWNVHGSDVCHLEVKL